MWLNRIEMYKLKLRILIVGGDKNMKRNNKFGFTLVELLAVIVILAIILVIAVPKIMNVIKDTTKASLESSAKMVAAQVENQYTVAQTLGQEFGDTGSCMEDWAGLNEADYESCTYEVEDGTAKVTLIGKGKFKDLSVCNGTRSSATSIEGECKDNSGVAYITELLAQESTLNNGLFVDDTDDKNIRYHGEDSNNYVYFNCKDTHNGKTYGSDGYAYDDACEVWRIIGIFDVAKTIGGSTEKRIKIIREPFTDSDGNTLLMSWDSSDENINSGEGINQWGPSGSYEGADSMRMLNGYYIGESTTCTYCNNSGSATCSIDCSNDILPISDSSLNMIENAVWNTRSIEQSDYTTKDMYELERTSELIKKECYRDEQYCNDNVTRTIEWEGKVGLMYPSDLGYACLDKECGIRNSYGSCYRDNWLYDSRQSWSITTGDDFNSAWFIGSFVNTDSLTSSRSLRPSTYLKSTVEIIGGNGGDEPFILK